MKINILLIEKNPVNQIITKKFIEKLGHQFVISDKNFSVENEENNFDLILLNTQSINDVDFSNYGKPIIGLLDNNSENEKVILKENGIENYLVRPFSINLLKKRIEESFSESSSKEIEEKEHNSFDKDALDSLREAFGDDGIKDLINVYLETFDDTVNSICEKLDDKNFEEASSFAHSLKSSTLSLGGKELGELCKKIEHNSDDDPIDSETINVLRDKSLEFKNYLNEILKS